MGLYIFLILGILGLICLGNYLKKHRINNVNKIMNSWLNHHKEELLSLLGPPESVFPIDNGREIWDYYRVGQTLGFIHKISDESILIDAPRKYKIKRQFFIDEHGIIYQYRWENI